MKRSLFFILLTTLIVLGSFYFMSFSEPEQQVLRAESGGVTLVGVEREANPFTVFQEEGEESAILFGPVYVFGPAEGTLEQPVVLYFDKQTTEGEENVLYWYNESLMMWEPLTGEGAVDRDRLGRFRLGRPVTVEAPNFLTTYDELRRLAPEHTVGFEMATSFRVEDGPEILLPRTRQIGGCGGVVGKGRTEERSLTQQSARVFLNDVETLLTFSFVGRWFVGDSGCEEGVALEPYVGM